MHAKITSKTARLARFFTGLILTSVLAACGGAASPGLIKDPSDIKKGRSSIPEGDSGVTFITLPFIAAESGVIKYTTFDISAVARSDYMPVSGEFSAIAGNQYAIQVEVLGDTRIEATEHFGVRLTDASDRLIGELIGEIVNDDFPEFGVSNPVAVERNTGITPLVFTISISEEPVDDFTLQVATRNPEVCKVGYASPREMEACAQDYSPLETTLTFRNGESLSQTVTVQVLADTRIEPDEIVELDVSFNGITKTGVGTIRNDDDMSRVFTSLKMLPARFREDANSTTETICVTFQYALRNAEYYDLHYELVALTEREWDAKSTGIDRADSSDFSLVNTSPESIRFTRSDTESQISLCGIQINDDSVVENDEVFGVRLTNAEGAYFYTGYVFIVDNDVPQFTLSARLGEKVVSTSGEEKTIQVEEPASGINLYTLTFTSDANIARGIQYFWSFPAGEASKDDFDGNLSAGVLSFSLVKESESHADRYEASIELSVKSDDLVEKTEILYLELKDLFGQTLIGPDGRPQKYTIFVNDRNALTLSYNCKVDGTVPTPFYFNEGNTVSCDISWDETIAPNALPITLTHKLLSCNEDEICASDADFDGDFLKGVVIANAQPPVKKANWTFGVLNDELVEAPETANIAVSAKNKDSGRAINIATSDPVSTFKIQDGDTLTLDTSCVKKSDNGVAGADSGLPFTEGDRVECITTTNMVAGNVPDFDLKAELADSCAHGLVCADPHDFKEFPESVIFAKADDVNNGIRTATWTAKIETDNLVELTETARFNLSVKGAVDLSSVTGETIEFTIKDGDELAITFNACPGMPGSTGTVPEFSEGATVTCTAQTNPVADNVPESAITLSVVLDGKCSDNTTGPCADLNDFKQFGKSVTFVMQSENGVDNGIRTASWSAEIEEDNLVELTETARFKLSLVEGAVNLSSDNEETIEFTIIDGDELAVTFNACPGMQGSTGIVSEFNEGDTVTCKIQTNAVAANVPAITLGVELLDCSVEGEEGSSDVVCAESADFGDDAQSGFPASLVLFADTDGVRAETWSSTVRIDNLIEKQETANFVMEVTVPDDVSVDGNSEGKLNFGFNINDGDRLVISYTPDSVDEGRTVTLTASPDIAESVGLITVSLSLAGCANSGEIACADWADFNHILQDNSLEVTFGYGSPTYLLKPEVDQSVEHTETAAFKVSVSKEFSPYFKQSEQSDIQDPVVGISSFAIEDSVSEEIPMTMSGDESFELSGSFSFDIADNDEFKFSMSRAALEGEIYGLTAVGAYQFHKKAVTYGFAFTPAVMVSESDDSCFVGNTDIRCQIEDRNKLLPIDLRNSSESVTLVGSGLEFSIQVELTNSSLLQTLASWFTVAVDGVAVNGVAVNGVAVTGIAPGIYSPVPINQPMLALNAETQSIGVPSVSAESGAIYPAINHIYLNKSGELMVPGEYGGEIYHPDCMIDNLTGLFWKRGSNLCNFKESDPKIDNAQGMPRPTISELLSLYSDPDNPIFGGLTGEIQSSSACPAGTPASVYWFNPDTGAVSCSAPAGPVVVPAETPELFVIPFKEGSLQ